MSDPKEVPREKTPKKQKTSNNAASTAAASGSATTDEEVYDMHAMAKDTQEPEDVAVLKWILGSMGVDKYEPRVIPQLLEFVHRYTSEILVDAQEYSTFANKPAIDADDIRLAAASRLKHTYAQIPSRELMMELAEKRNALPLPPIPSEYGVRLPPVEHQLTAENIRLYPNHHVRLPLYCCISPSLCISHRSFNLRQQRLCRCPFMARTLACRYILRPLPKAPATSKSRPPPFRSTSRRPQPTSLFGQHKTNILVVSTVLVAFYSMILQCIPFQ
ncbi:hypothetical protein H257_13565 [Aphanomyces astaci]|uniref:Transcription initiation factor TFIID subunit 9 n=1 Tax=Aphanomyces astaci TaxID=112090 RepID=W4FWL6_APHAT|nr:hypothetical protein H257_13565 [Aphanomyces astaci]ETV71179.1 hypothetical protein H257_13565 [Aphanomyces astaci]|eukprot:XP_009839425.1 hypothetical protein H257_13565 [Aphanomyces astaci]